MTFKQDELEQLRERFQAVMQLFSGGPDTPCRTTWRDESQGIPGVPKTECVEVPLADLIEALGVDP